MAHWQWIFGGAALLLVAGYGCERFGEWRDAKRHPAPGRMVSVGGRKLHLLRKGSEGPAVVIEQGAGEPSRYWWPLQERIADFATVCVYDRAGYGWSEPAPAGRTIAQRADDLHELLAIGGIPAPYLLAAHSYGGLIVREFARRYRGETAGLMLVDTPEEATFFRSEVLDLYSKIRVMQGVLECLARFGALRFLSLWLPLDRFGFPFVRPREYAAARDDLASLELVSRPQRESGGFGMLGDLPLIVITHGQPFPGPFAVLEEGWSEGQKRLAGLSTNSLLFVAQNSNHMIQLDEPEVVLDAIRRMHFAARGKQPLADGIISPAAAPR